MKKPHLLDLLTVEEATMAIESLKILRQILVAQNAMGFMKGKMESIISDTMVDVDALTKKLSDLLDSPRA